jgi:hypothetical protein
MARLTTLLHRFGARGAVANARAACAERVAMHAEVDALAHRLTAAAAARGAAPAAA